MTSTTSTTTSTQRTCYFPTGVAAPGNVPCSSDEHTSCCGETDLCLDNGLCLNVGHQPYVLSRGACTNQKWDSGCPQWCSDVAKSGGVSIINLDFIDGVSTYCCGTPVSDGDSVVCPDGTDSFELPSGSPVLGYAMLANVSSFAASSPSASTSPSPGNTKCPGRDTCHEAAIGAGVGASLGAVALGFLAWALLERRRAKQAVYARVTSLTPVQQDRGGGYAADRKGALTELDTTRRGPVVEIMDSER